MGRTASTPKLPLWVHVSTQYEVEGRKVRVVPARGGKSLQHKFHYKDASGKDHYAQGAGFKTVQDALDKAEEILVAARKRVYVHTAMNTSVDALGELYVNKYHLMEGSGASTIANTRLAFRRLSPLIGSISLWDLTRDDAERAHDALTKTLKGQPLNLATRAGYLGQLRSALTWAMQRGIVTENVARQMTIQRRKPKELRAERMNMYVPTDQDIANILDLQLTMPGVRDHMLHEIVSDFLAHTGCRVGEALTLRRDNIDRDKMTVAVGGKSESSYRKIPIDAELLASIDRLSGRWLLSKGMVFAQANGEVLDASTVRKRMKAIGQRLGLPDCRPHLFRHYRASRWLGDGMPIERVSKLLGHKNVGITSAIYSHFIAGDAADEVAASSDKLRALRKPVALHPVKRG